MAAEGGINEQTKFDDDTHEGIELKSNTRTKPSSEVGALCKLYGAWTV